MYKLLLTIKSGFRTRAWLLLQNQFYRKESESRKMLFYFRKSARSQTQFLEGDFDTDGCWPI